MTMHLLLLGFIGALSGVLAIVASFRIDPFYSWLIRSVPVVRVNYVPTIRALYSARQAIEEEVKEIEIRHGREEELQTIHQILIDEFGFSEQYYPVRLNFTRYTIELEYADGSIDRESITREDLLSLVDSRISKILGRVALFAGIIAAVAFAVLIGLAVV